jgi:hypothetical protein
VGAHVQISYHALKVVWLLLVFKGGFDVRAN